MEQSTEWQSTYFNFDDFAKALDGVDRERLWETSAAFWSTKEGCKCYQRDIHNFLAQVVHNNKLLDPFKIRIGVRQGCFKARMFPTPIFVGN